MTYSKNEQILLAAIVWYEKKIPYPTKLMAFGPDSPACHQYFNNLFLEADEILRSPDPFLPEIRFTSDDVDTCRQYLQNMAQVSNLDTAVIRITVGPFRAFPDAVAKILTYYQDVIAAYEAMSSRDTSPLKDKLSQHFKAAHSKDFGAIELGYLSANAGRSRLILDQTMALLESLKQALNPPEPNGIDVHP